MRTTGVAMAGLGLLLIATQVNAGELECRSSGYHYQYCPADTRNNVQLAQKLSNASCDYGRGWGYDQRGVWVDNGCAGMFTYGGGGGHYGGGGHGHGDNVAAGVAAAVILGALISAGNDHHGQDNGGYHDDRGYQGNRGNGGGYGDDRGYQGNRGNGGGYGVNVPAWAVGHFAGSDREGGPDIEIAVDPDGRINGMQGSTMFDGQMRGTEAWLGNRSFTVVRSGDGIRLVGSGHGGFDLYRE